MKVSRRSWHYRLYRFISNIPKGPRYLNPLSKVDRTSPEPPKSLCPYFWAICLGLLGTLVVGLVALIVLVVVGPFWLAGVTIYRGCLALDAKLWRFKRNARPHDPREKKRAKRERKPSLLVSYVKARKNKVCPPIELVD